MKKFYLISAIVVTVFILILSFAQVGASCSWLIIGAQPAFLVLLQLAALGAVVGGLMVLWWKQPKSGADASGAGDDSETE